MKINNRDIRWCITHECYDEVFELEGLYHIDYDTECPISCQGPFTESEPPKLEENWQDHLTSEADTDVMIDLSKHLCGDYLMQ